MLSSRGSKLTSTAQIDLYPTDTDLSLTGSSTTTTTTVPSSDSCETSPTVEGCITMVQGQPMHARSLHGNLNGGPIEAEVYRTPSTRTVARTSRE
ncbi:hypothetical protein D9611_008135 [Ephemerocybe angulata]|uniref:Uncharacterized protein n=1 Tax=Ephemerocybe angulata TaxID=980116 RepID=A0A8H5FCV9_9AGAR|nr:hypothetical protein D9611_008135 [Tulosesus angulatus]